MSNVLSESKQQQVVALGRLSWSLRRIAKAAGVNRRTAVRYLEAAGIAVRGPRKRQAPEQPQEVSPVKVHQLVITGSEAAPVKVHPSVITGSELESKAASEVITGFSLQNAPSQSACAPHKEFIEQSLSIGRNAMAIYQDLVTDYGFAFKYASVLRFVRTLQPAAAEAHPRFETAPGEEAQVDYGEGPMVRDERGKHVKTRLFVFTLGCSRKSVRLIVFKSSSKKWCELHEEAFRRLGGVPRIIVLDNLKEGVLKPDIYDPVVNSLYKDMLSHYGCTALPARICHSDRKGKVESSVGHAQKTPLKGLRFETLDDAQAYLDRWEERFADTRIHGTTKRQVAQMFAEERPSLLSLPLVPFRYYEYGKRKVHLDGCVEVASAYYGAPPGRIGTEVLVQWDSLRVRLIDPKTGELLREHVRTQPGHFRVAEKDKPKKTPSSTAHTLERAARVGKNVGALCRKLHLAEGELGVRRILGVISLGKKYGVASLDDACAVALETNIINYRFVRRYLERKPTPLVSLKQVDPLIRQLNLYRDMINNIEKGQPQ